MNEHLRDRVLRKLDTLSDERAYQVLDYIEFLESKYAERQAPPTSIFTRFSEAVEDRLRAGKISASAIAETMGLMNRAMNVLSGVATGVAAAGRSVASDLERATATRPAGATGPSGPSRPVGSAAGSATPPSGAPVAGRGVSPDAPSGPPPSQSVPPGATADPRTTESGELEPPVEG
ncbi:MAG: hypothetical protein ABR499_10300 [Gemmatimonadaceae bacterium]